MFPNTSVVPSGSALATRVLPIVPPAPAMFSTRTRVDSFSLMPSATRRAIVSVGPPAAKGATMVICFEESADWAAAEPADKATSRATSDGLNMGAPGMALQPAQNVDMLHVTCKYNRARLRRGATNAGG